MSFLDNARRAFGGKLADEYDDRYEDEYEDYEEEEPKKSFFSFLGKREEPEEEYEETYEQESAPSRSYSYSRASATRERYNSGFGATKTTTAPTPSRSSLAGVEVTVHYPTSLDDATRIIREVKSNRITLFDISAITSDEEARRVVDYIGGAAFGMECPFERLCPSIFCMAPVGVKIDAKKNKY